MQRPNLFNAHIELRKIFAPVIAHRRRHENWGAPFNAGHILHLSINDDMSDACRLGPANTPETDHG